MEKVFGSHTCSGCDKEIKSANNNFVYNVVGVLAFREGKRGGSMWHIFHNEECATIAIDAGKVVYKES